MVKKGYSLAETLIVIALIMIMAGLFLNSDLPRRKLTIQREAYILSQNIRTMENNAGNARSSTNCNVPNLNSISPNPDGGLYPFDGYAIMLDKDMPWQYLIYTNCNESFSFPELGDNISLSGPSSQEGSFLFNPAKSPQGNVSTEKCSPTDQTPCDYYNDNRGGVGYINELIAIRKFPTSIKLKDGGLRAFIKKDQWGWEDCSQIIIDFKPTTPVTYIICRVGDGAYYGAREGSITITDGDNERIVTINKAGLVAPKSDTQ
ncbi:MAG: type II secretion system protein [Candidatus Paceibacterota bacterium]